MNRIPALAPLVLASSPALATTYGKTFWSPRYGMLTDRFGIGWMVMVPSEPTP